MIDVKKIIICSLLMSFYANCSEGVDSQEHVFILKGARHVGIFMDSANGALKYQVTFSLPYNSRNNYTVAELRKLLTERMKNGEEMKVGDITDSNGNYCATMGHCCLDTKTKLFASFVLAGINKQ